MRKLVVVGLLVGCTASSDVPSFEFRLRFDRQDGTVSVNGVPTTAPIAFTADSYEDARNDLVLDVSVATATGAINVELRPGYCATQAVGGQILIESLGYVVLESSPPQLALSSYWCEGTAGGAAGGP